MHGPRDVYFKVGTVFTFNGTSQKFDQAIKNENRNVICRVKLLRKSKRLIAHSDSSGEHTPSYLLKQTENIKKSIARRNDTDRPVSVPLYALPVRVLGELDLVQIWNVTNCS